MQAAERKRSLRRQLLGVLVERLLEEAKRRRREREDLIRVAAHLRAQLLRRNDAVDEAPALGLLRVVLAAQKPDLSRALLAHHARQVARAEARIEGAHARARLTEAGMLRGDRKVAQDVQHVAAADRQAVDRRDHRLGDLADRAVQCLDLEQPAVRGAVIAALGPLLLIAARAEGALAGSRERHHAHLRRRPGALEALDQLIDRMRGERVEPLGTVDGDPAQALLDLVAHVGQLLHLDSAPSAGSLGRPANTIAHAVARCTTTPRPRLGHRQPAAHRQRLPGDVARLLGREEGHGMGHLPGAAQAPSNLSLNECSCSSRWTLAFDCGKTADARTKTGVG